jgi:hypothetical protein
MRDEGLRDEANPASMPWRDGNAVIRRSGVLTVVLLAAVAVGLTLQSRSSSPFAASPAQNARAAVKRAPSSEDASVKVAADQYAAGRYAEAERAALDVADGSGEGAEERARARWVLAFSAARRKEFAVAREQFAELRKDGAVVPDAKLSDEAGDGEPTLEEEGAYQHAVLTLALASESEGSKQKAVGRKQPRPGLAKPTPEGEAGGRDASRTPGMAAALGGKIAAGVSGGSHPSSFILHPSRADAEREFMAFLREYPESPLAHAAMRRIARMHGGDVPEEAERLWRRAMTLQRSREAERERERSMCGPEVLHEVLRRAAGPEGRRQKAEGRQRPVAGGQQSAVGGQPPAVGGQQSAVGGQQSAGVAPGLRGKNAAGAGGDARAPRVEELAREMGTDARGTTLAALAKVARRYGFEAKGLRLTFSGLLRVASAKGVQVFAHTGGRMDGSSGIQGAKGRGRGDGVIAGRFLPPHSRTSTRPYVIALIRPGHFVLVERVSLDEVRVWNPSPGGQGGGGRGEGEGGAAARSVTYRRKRWEAVWDGVALCIR